MKLISQRHIYKGKADAKSTDVHNGFVQDTEVWLTCKETEVLI